MKKLSFALAAFAFAMPAVAAQGLAPAVKRKPAAAATAPQQAAEPATERDNQATPSVASAPAPQQAARRGSERDYQTALTAVATQGNGDAALDSSLIGVMSRLLAAGRCAEAAGLAARGGRKELASRAQQLCK
jgi:hypothetical protein